MMREIETWLSDSRVGDNSVVEHRSRRPVLSLYCATCASIDVMSCLTILGVEMVPNSYK